MEYFIFNGKYHAVEATVLSVNSRGLRFGDGLFETMKAVNTEIEFCDEHFARLWNGLQVLQFNIPKFFSPDHLQHEIIALLKKNGHHKKARIRLTVFRGDGGLYDEISNTPNYLIQSWPLPDDNGKWNSNGLVLGIYNDVKKSCDILSNLKHNNFLPYAMAARHAKNQRWNDAVLLNSDGGICDSTIANIFLIRDNIVFTPSLQEGCIAGVMRKNIIARLANNYKLIETRLTVDDLFKADEVFLTNSIYNMRWVQNIGDIMYGNKLSQKIYADFF